MLRKGKAPLPNSTSSSCVLAFPFLFLSVFCLSCSLPGASSSSVLPITHPWAPHHCLGAQKHLAMGPWSRELILFYCKPNPEQQFLWKRLQPQLPTAPLQPFQPSKAVHGFCSCPISVLQILNPFQETKSSLAWPGGKAELCSCPCTISRRCTNPGYSFYSRAFSTHTKLMHPAKHIRQMYEK